MHHISPTNPNFKNPNGNFVYDIMANSHAHFQTQRIKTVGGVAFCARNVVFAHKTQIKRKFQIFSTDIVSFIYVRYRKNLENVQSSSYNKITHKFGGG